MKRYWQDYGGMEEDEDGEWVKWEDVRKMLDDFESKVLEAQKSYHDVALNDVVEEFIALNKYGEGEK
jgi:hypothetical protein